MDYRGRRDLPRGIRNNNPGNLRVSTIKWQGKVPLDQNSDKSFEQFTNMAFGIRAMATDLINDVAKGKDTLRTLIAEYAPPNENDTTGYINQVANRVGISPDQKLKLDNALLKKIIQAKIIVENGIKAAQLIPGTTVDQGINMINAATKKRISWQGAASVTGLIALAGLLFFLAKN
jgi:phosphotransferase system IIB component